MNAKEAKKRATARAKIVERKELKRERDEIMLCIKYAVNWGYFDFTTSSLLYKTTEEYLRGLGYKVIVGDDWTRIEWE